MKKLLFLILSALFVINVQSQTFSSGHLGIPIPDNYTALNLEINVLGLPNTTSENFGLESICVDIEHERNRELILQLLSPDNTIILLAAHNAGQNYTNTCFKYSAPEMISFGTPPFTGNFTPEGDMGQFNNSKNPNGEWKLRLFDSQAGANTGKINNWSITFGNNPAKPFLSSDLPVLVINTNEKFIVSSERIMVDFGVIYNGPGQRNYLNSTPNHYNGKGSIKTRGQSSQMFPKKSYSIDTVDPNGEDVNVPLLGMPSEHKWVLHAAFNDKSLIRNYLAYRLSGELGHYAPRTRFVELVIDGNYRGVYLLTEKIKRDKNRVAISKNDVGEPDNDITGGYIVRIDKWSDSRDSWLSNYPSNTNGNKVRFQYEFPRPKNIQQSQKDYIREHFHQFENALMNQNFTDPNTGYRKYIDTRSFIDHFLINEISKDVDAYRISTYLYKDKDSKDGKIYNGPVWDYDLAWFNSDFGGGNKTDGWQYQYGFDFQQPNPGEGDSIYPNPFWWRRFMEDPAFVEELNCRYQNMRRDGYVFDINRINGILDSEAQFINEARIRNFNYWPILGKYTWPNPAPWADTYEGEMDKLKNWINNRIAWLDANMPGTCPDVGIKQDIFASSIKTYPNPFVYQVNFNYHLRENSNLEIDLYNSIGVKLKEIFKGNQSSGVYYNQIDASDLPGGIYFLNVKVDHKVYQQKLVKLN
jgi:subtilisin-like proprotein convertase family protein